MCPQTHLTPSPTPQVNSMPRNIYRGRLAVRFHPNAPTIRIYITFGEMTTPSNTLAWKIPWMKEPGRLQSMGSQRVRHAWATSLSFLLVLVNIFIEWVEAFSTWSEKAMEVSKSKWKPHYKPNYWRWWIPVELFQILKDDAVKVLHLICQQIWKTQQWKRLFFIPIPY